VTLALILFLLGTLLVYGGWKGLSIRSLVAGDNSSSSGKAIQ